MSEPGKAAKAEQEAARWIARLEAEDVSLDDHRRFRVWLQISPENRTAYEALSRTWDQLDALKFDKQPGVPPRPSSRRLFLTGAAGIAAVSIVGVSTWMVTAGTSEAAAYETPVGGRQSITLSDGSRIELNAASRAVVEYSRSKRKVSIERGEVLFEITADPDRPFEIETRFGEFRVDAAVLSVKVNDGAARATIVEGALEAQRPWSAALEAGLHQEVTLSTASITENIDAAAIERRLAWRRGMLAFDGETLREAAADVAQQTGARFEFADEATASLRVGGYIDARDLNAFLALLRDNLGVAATTTATGEIVLAT